MSEPFAARTGGSAAAALSNPQGSSANLADILERVLDKGIVIAGDIQINLLDIELLTIKLRLLVASVDKAKEMGIDWWEHDPSLSSRARPAPREATADGERQAMEIERLRAEVAQLRAAQALPSPAPDRAQVPPEPLAADPRAPEDTETPATDLAQPREPAPERRRNDDRHATEPDAKRRRSPARRPARTPTTRPPQDRTPAESDETQDAPARSQRSRPVRKKAPASEGRTEAGPVRRRPRKEGDPEQ
ncbi:gas vesicle protein GvpA/GvpJ/GvpM family [Streptomyces sp. PsTaAH-137]|uniref:gas vesicle protein n=1 Tax=Streptomyces sp. PsTaAH-137 TaxID=1305830 RepID=UPI000DC23E61|nr:gas vesicle protein GvpA/GvpJ/GvpM family [Streptomyces sp. PsTaAH-137]